MFRLSLILFFLSFLACHRDPLKREFFQAEKLINEGRYEEAVTVYERAMSQHSDTPEAVQAARRVGEIYQYQIKNNLRALEAYENLSQQFPNSEDALLALERKADLFEEDNNYPAALIEYQKMIDLQTERKLPIDKFRYKSAAIYFKMKDYAQAQMELGNFLKDFPKSQWQDQALFDLAESFFFQKRYEECIRTYQRLIYTHAKSPLKIQAQFNLALAWEETGEWNKALDLYHSILDTHPNPKLVSDKIQHLEEIKRKTQRG